MRKLLLLLLSSVIAGCVTPRPPEVTPEQRKAALPYLQQGVLQLRARQYDQAFAYFTLASELAPMPEARDGMGCVAAYKGDLKAAEKIFITVIKEHPRYATAYSNLARVLELQGRGDEAGKYFRAALALEPKDYRARNNYAAHLFERKDIAGARLELQKGRAVVRDQVIEDNLRKVR
jgi:Flp pilus assembly protein TadD